MPKHNLTVQDVWKAKKRIAQIVKKTPLIQAPQLSEICGCPVYLKLENMHETGAFKVRGAANKILSLSEAEKKRGVTTFSTGNHGLAVAHVARRLGIRAVICISERVPEAKVNAIRRMGAELAVRGKSQDEAQAYCSQLQEEEGLSVIKPFDDPDVIAGQGTLALEILEDCPAADTFLIPLSGGGLFAGIALAAKANVPGARTIGISMERSAVMCESLKAGKPVTLEESDTLADSLLGGIGKNNEYTFELVRRLADDTVLIPEDAIAEGMAHLYRCHRMVVEGAAAVGVGALLRNRIRTNPENRIVVVVSGNNVDLRAFEQAISPFVSSA